MNGRNDREQIFSTLRSEILDGTLAPGTALREVALAERFEVSRTPVRDALPASSSRVCCAGPSAASRCRASILRR